MYTRACTHTHTRDVNDLHMIQQDMAEIVGDQGEAMGRIGGQVDSILALFLGDAL